jgi:hypothetical protein
MQKPKQVKNRKVIWHECQNAWPKSVERELVALPGIEPGFED